MNANNKSLLYIHVSVFLFGFSALFARLVNQPSIVITFGRVLFSSVFLFVLTRLNKIEIKLDSKKDYLLIAVSGIILAVHWYCFIQSIQLSTVAIGTITFSTFPVFVSFLEPIFFREKIKARTVICSILMLGGILIIAADNTGEGSTNRTLGIIVGLVSSLTYAALSLLNRNFSRKYKSEVIVFYEQVIAAIVILPLMFIVKPVIAVNDILLLAILGIVFTAIAHGLFVKGLRYVKASTAGVISGLEAVYAIVLASVLLKEIPALNEIAGGLVVIVLAGYMTLVWE
ncbi:MAG: DMT family transporter [Treponema sp.]|jgi:drug/metabolite transporter (DMT)-like permease|nr:DMT family transporter [Treponema sp.]